MKQTFVKRASNLMFFVLLAFVSLAVPHAALAQITINSLTANPSTVASGQSTTISWNASVPSPGSCSLNGSAVPNSGQKTFNNLTATTTYTLFCATQGGINASRSVTVTVTQPSAPTASISANPTSVQTGQSTTLSWSASVPSGGGCTGSWTGGSLPLNGQQTINNLSATTTFTITCTGGGQSVSKSVTVSVSLAACAPAWSPNAVSYAYGAQVSYQGNNYKCLQSHTSQPGWDPKDAPALWGLIGACH